MMNHGFNFDFDAAPLSFASGPLDSLLICRRRSGPLLNVTDVLSLLRADVTIVASEHLLDRCRHED